MYIAYLRQHPEIWQKHTFFDQSGKRILQQLACSAWCLLDWVHFVRFVLAPALRRHLILDQIPLNVCSLPYPPCYFLKLIPFDLHPFHPYLNFSFNPPSSPHSVYCPFYFRSVEAPASSWGRPESATLIILFSIVLFLYIKFSHF